MARKMIVQLENGSSPVLTEEAAEDEGQLQEMMKTNPDLLPVDEFGMTGPLMVVGRETTLPSGAVDLVAVARSGELLIVEFKTGPQNADFRAALAQLLDYGADLWSLSYDGTIYAENPHDPFDDTSAIYPRGARVLHMLRHELGDEVFFTAVRAYLDEYAGSTATTEEFRDAIESSALVDLDWFFEQWIYAPGRPELVVWHRPYLDGADERVEVFIKQLQPHRRYRLSVDVLVRAGSDWARHERQLISADSALTVLDLPSPGGAVSGVGIDPDGALLAHIADNGYLDRSDVPALHIVTDRRAGVGTLTCTLAVATDDDISAYDVEWDLDGGTEESASGTSITATFVGLALGDYWTSPRPRVRLVAADDSEIIYPASEVRVYDAQAYADPADGDVNWDGVINGVDLALVSAARGMDDERATLILSGDVDGDGDIDDADVELISERFATVLGKARR